MPSPNIGELLDFQTQLCDATGSILTAGFAGLTPTFAPQVLVPRDSDTELTPRVEVGADIGIAIRQYTTIGQASPRQVPIAYEFALSLRMVTTRPDDNARMSKLHPVLVGYGRYFMSAGAKLFTETNLPWLQILDLWPTQCGSQLQDHKEQDVDVLTWAGKFAVRDAYWPALA